MRWRRLAAKVWPTDTDSTNPTTLIKSAGTHSSCHKAQSQTGVVRGGKPWGTVPTSFTPCACQSSHQASRVVTAIAATGPVLAVMSAILGERPTRINKGFNPFRTQNKNAVAAMPTTSVSKCTCEACCIKAMSKSTKLWPSAFTPMSVFIWLKAMSKPEAEMKPEMTGWLKKIGQETQAQQTHQQQHAARQKRQGAGHLPIRMGACGGVF